MDGVLSTYLAKMLILNLPPQFLSTMLLTTAEKRTADN
jgi:hypothetical protein